MNEKQFKMLFSQSLTLLGVCVVLLILFSGGDFHQRVGIAKAGENQNKAIVVPEMDLDEKTPFPIEDRNEINWKGAYFSLEMDTSAETKVFLQNDYVNKEIILRMEKQKAGAITLKQLRYSKGIIRKSKVLETATDNHGMCNVELRLQFHKIYEPVIYRTVSGYYVALMNPRKYYKHIVVVDAGHGGSDAGTYDETQVHLEKDYALAVVEQMKELLVKKKIKVYYTRLSDHNIPNKARTKLANELNADLLLSVHCNASDPGETSANGVETLYSEKANSGKITNKEFAEKLLYELADSTGLKKRQVIERPQLYLLHHSKVPATIVEIGYMSNKGDMQYMRSKYGRTRIAQSLVDGIADILGE